MKVLFEFSRGGLPKNASYLSFIRSFLLDNDFRLTNDLLKDSETTKDYLPENTFFNLQKAISRADCVIIEGSVVSISLGYVLTEAINLGKPVLFLVNRDQVGTTNRFVSSIKSKLLSNNTYLNETELEKYLSEFCTNNKFIKTRFNLVLPHRVDSFIIEQSQARGISKTEYILDLVNQQMGERE